MSNVRELEINNVAYDIVGKAVVDQNNPSTPLKQWSGTKAQYDSLVSGGTVDANTIYNITDDTNPTQALLESIYPVGSIYIGTMNTCPLAALFGTWTLVAADRVLQGAGTRGSVGTTVNESLPNIKGYIPSFRMGSIATGDNPQGAFTLDKGDTNNLPNLSGVSGFSTINQLRFNANNSSSTYQDSAPVQQDAYLVNIWERTA